VKRLWQRVAMRIDKMSLRERASIFAALVVLIVALGNAALLDPEWSKQKVLSRQLAQRQGDLAAVQDQIQKLAAIRQSSPERANQERLARLRREIAETESRIAEEQKRLTRPEQMRSVLEEMLGRNRRVSLLGMKTLPPGPATQAGAVVPKPAADGAKPASDPAAQTESPVYRHGLELTVSGTYFDLLAYVADLERLPTQLYWGGAELDASDYPVLKMKLVVFTLSLDKAWMSV
jgi:MSHA biogenesis protein MshJ